MLVLVPIARSHIGVHDVIRKRRALHQALKLIDGGLQECYD